ncbi:hypothetical protein OH809_09430 [Streptomyces sp. NBC_00873]|nr:hypothetical protein OH809_09430 [Streptomyces sp. NBC_00873]WTA47100.1 hypothetical protein OH821_34390 [Streptomyces sp. NBC_00842]
MKIYNWRPLLKRWSTEWVDARMLEDPEEVDEELRRERWLGFAPATEE